MSNTFLEKHLSLASPIDCIVVGAGHAGCEAAMALAKLGHTTVLVTSNVTHMGHLSCNPAIGGLAKGHMVCEIDALGGMIGRWADEAGIQFRTLNSSKGPAVRATRAQIDRNAYIHAVQRDIFAQENLLVIEDAAETILHENGKTYGIITKLGRTLKAAHVLLTTGTFLNGTIHVGLTNFPGGRLGDAPAVGISDSLRNMGIQLGRLKTGTPPRIHKDSINFSVMEEQAGDSPLPLFSFHGKGNALPQIPCYITWTNEKTHDVIRSGFDRSPMFTGVISGTGARYCPSVEDKIARFPEKERHHIFIEPEGIDSAECYPNGISTSLPLDIQIGLIHTVKGLENAHVVRPGYAIEYDFANPIQLLATLESKISGNLWFAGQINGTSGYEEAAAQGLWAAFNISAQLKGLPPFLLGREQAYIAVLVDDLVTLGTEEPYRMFTSRAEYRLLLRQDNADARLSAIGRERGLVPDDVWEKHTHKMQAIAAIITKANQTKLPVNAALHAILESLGETVPSSTLTLAELMKRPNITFEHLLPLVPEYTEFTAVERKEAETSIKYAGYLTRQEELVKKALHNEQIPLPDTLDYTHVAGLTREVVEKLQKITPRNLGQAGRISGITPAAISCLEIHLKKMQKIYKITLFDNDIL